MTYVIPPRVARRRKRLWLKADGHPIAFTRRVITREFLANGLWAYRAAYRQTRKAGLLRWPQLERDVRVLGVIFYPDPSSPFNDLAPLRVWSCEVLYAVPYRVDSAS